MRVHPKKISLHEKETDDHCVSPALGYVTVADLDNEKDEKEPRTGKPRSMRETRLVRAPRTAMTETLSAAAARGCKPPKDLVGHPHARLDISYQYFEVPVNLS